MTCQKDIKVNVKIHHVDVVVMRDQNIEEEMLENRHGSCIYPDSM